jgi:hypothetical protein
MSRRRFATLCLCLTLSYPLWIASIWIVTWPRVVPLGMWLRYEWFTWLSQQSWYLP